MALNSQLFATAQAAQGWSARSALAYDESKVVSMNTRTLLGTAVAAVAVTLTGCSNSDPMLFMGPVGADQVVAMMICSDSAGRRPSVRSAK